MNKIHYLILTLVIAILIFRLDVGAALNAFNYSNSSVNKTTSKKEDTISQENHKLEQHNYSHKPESMVERLVTNVVSDFVKTPAGSEMAKKMIKPENFIPYNSDVTYPTRGFKGYQKKYQISYEREGSGQKVICGQSIKAQILVSNLNNEVINSKVIDYRVGDSDYEEYNIFPIDEMPNSLFKGKFLSMDFIESKKGFGTKHNLTFTILKLNEKYSENFDNIEIYDDYINTARPAICGDNVYFYYHIYSMKGEDIFSSSMETRIGSQDNSSILNYIATNLNLTGKRNVIIETNKIISNSKRNFLPTNYKKTKDNFVKLKIDKVTILPKNKDEK